MNTITNIASTNTILAIDLGKCKSVACIHDQAAGEIRFTTFETTRAELSKRIAQEQPAVIIIEANLRVENTIVLSATATRGLDRIDIAAGGMIPCPSTGFEVFVPGRQGIRACRDSNPACGSADLLGAPSAVSSLSGSFPWCRGGRSAA